METNKLLIDQPISDEDTWEEQPMFLDSSEIKGNLGRDIKAEITQSLTEIMGDNI